MYCFDSSTLLYIFAQLVNVYSDLYLNMTWPCWREKCVSVYGTKSSNRLRICKKSENHDDVYGCLFLTFTCKMYPVILVYLKVSNEVTVYFSSYKIKRKS